MTVGPIEYQAKESHKVKRVYLMGFYTDQREWLYRLMGITSTHELLYCNFLIMCSFDSTYPNRWVFGGGIKADSYQQAWDMVNQVMPEGVELMPNSPGGW
jgi:hypothetical protein